LPERPGSLLPREAPGRRRPRQRQPERPPHRSARYNLSIDAFWFDPALGAAAIDWARSTWQAMRPFSKGGVYMNFAGLADDTEHLRQAMLGALRAHLRRI
jgi:hypothetical protein